MAIASALPEGATLYTYERVESLALQMHQMFQENPQVSTHHGAPPGFADCMFAFIDSGPAYEDRMFDVLRWAMTSPPDAICLVDDVEHEWFEHLKIDAVILPTHTGLALLRQPKI